MRTFMNLIISWHRKSQLLTALFFATLLLCVTAPPSVQAGETWSPTGSLGYARRQHTATVLADGRVLAAGGRNTYGSPMGECEIFNSSAGGWFGAGALGTERYQHAATLLGDGRVLAVGGNGYSGYLSSAEVYDPANGTWSDTASLSAARQFHTATRLEDGRVLVAGGENGGGKLASAEDL